MAFVEVKRAAQNLHDRHLRQVETYAVKEGVEWVILTNGQSWRVYHIQASRAAPVETNLVFDVDILGDAPLGTKVDSLFYLHQQALRRAKIDSLWKQKAATSPVALVDVLLSEVVLDTVRKEIRRRSGYNPDTSALSKAIGTAVVRPELLVVLHENTPPKP